MSCSRIWLHGKTLADAKQQELDQIQTITFSWHAGDGEALVKEFSQLLPRFTSHWSLKLMFTPYDLDLYDRPCLSFLHTPIPEVYGWALNRCLVEAVRHLPSLERLSLDIQRDTEDLMEPATWTELSKLKSLKAFELMHMDLGIFVRESFLASLTKALPSLEELSIGLRADNTGDYGTLLKYLMEHLPNLQKLNLYLCGVPVTEEELNVLYDFPNLTHLNVRNLKPGEGMGQLVSRDFFVELICRFFH
eukprot:GILI01035148.1.p1 GENE.GILI01035148.1~~GILI01035148.1.p1  ORF type:complete len:257 (+),score=-2.78 GILI01035148.1:30-773(+)